MSRSARTALAALLAALHTPAQDDMELGRMWTFEDPPLDYLEQQYGFRPDRSWLDAVRLASLRFGSGCSAAFVSPHGLIMTNHHCVRGNIATAQGEHDWVAHGYVARRPEDEVRLPGLTVQQLVAIRDVTAAVNAGVADGDDPAVIERKRADNRKELMSAAAADRPDLRAEIVELFQGARVQLYSYKVYDDVRLVAAPHLQTAHFGGDPDNFTYPRFGIDFAFCRAYEDGRPATTEDHYFRWRAAGPKPGELVFVTGNPGSTERLLTKAQLEYHRDARHPILRELIDNRLQIMRERAATGPELEKQLRTNILAFENAQKAYRGMHEALLDPRFMARKEAAERRFRARIAADPALEQRYGRLWDELAEVAAARTALEAVARFQSTGGSHHLRRALALVEHPERADEALAIPVRMSAVDTAFFVDHLARARRWLAADDPFLAAMLGGREPAAAAAWLEEGSRIADDAFVRELGAGGEQAIAGCDDPAIRVARVLAPLAARNEAAGTALDEREAALGTALGRALFAVYGTSVSPDATFTLRFTDGVVKGYPCNGTIAPYRTTFYGLYARNLEFGDEHPFDLPAIWLERRDRIDLGKAVDFVCTADTTGGNSGSPVISKDREIVGLLFDGNIESLANDYLFRDEVERSVCVHTEGITEALAKIYEAERVLAELEGRQ